MRRTFALTLLAVLCLSLSLLTRTRAETLQARVVEVQDGKSITIETSGRTMKVVLKAAEAPELEQPLGDVARQHLSDLVLGKQVSVELTGMDYNSRYFVARVFAGENDISLQMIRDGVAWFDRRYEREMSERERFLYNESEQAARNERRGIWQDAQPVPPWQWRQSKSAERNKPAAVAPATAPARAAAKSPIATREDKGWDVFTPPGAPFSVRMPGSGKQFSTVVRLPQGETVSIDIYGVSHLKIGYIALWASGPAGDETLDTLFDQMLVQLNRAAMTGRLPCEFTRKKDAVMGGYTGRRYTVDGCYFHGGIRLYYKLEGKTLRACLVGVLGEDPKNPSINQFLESFVINQTAKR